MAGLKTKCGIVFIAIFAIYAVLLALSQLLQPAPNGCAMTYMYPTYIPIPTVSSSDNNKYGLFLYHEGWQQIDFARRVKNLAGLPVLFVPGNGGSYKQVRSLAAESFRAYQSGPPEPTFYQEASFPVPDGGDEFGKFTVPDRYGRTLDWFAVDLEGEHSAMDGRILEEHTEYVVYSIHRILDQYKESFEKRKKEGSKEKLSDVLPKSVIIVGHSMGGFVARAALVHPFLREGSVETILTLSSPHQSPPVALQPSLGHYFSNVIQEWKNGYKSENKKFSNLVVISISGGINDYQVRSKLTSLDGIVPATHGFTIGSTEMKNVWLSMEHQTILWCNQLVVQVSHTLLSIIDPETKRPFLSPQKRLFIFTKMLQTAIPQALSWTKSSTENSITVSKKEDLFSCPESVKWVQDGLERDLHIKSNIITVLAMDGRRRWLDINKLGSDGKDHFVFVTNLAPCTGVRIHLWPEKVNNSVVYELSQAGKRIIEVTSKMVHVPAGPAPKQVEPGSQTEQPPPSSFLRLSPQDLKGFRFLTISVAPRPTVSGRPPPAASMAVGQFFNPKQGEREFSLSSLLHSIYSPKEIDLEENHALEQKLSFSVSLGLLPVSLSLKTTGCGIKASTDKSQDEQNRLCKLRCFPPVALTWDSVSGLHIIPNIYSQVISVDSSPALKNPVPSEKTSLILLADPHCSYRASISVSVKSSASRFFLLYSSQIVGFMLCTMFYILMHQAHAYESDSSIPSILQALEMNLNLFHKTFLLLFFVPIMISLLYSFFIGEPLPFLSTFIPVTFICYIISNGLVILVVFVSKSVLYSFALLHVLVKRRWQAWESNISSPIVNQILHFSSSFRSTKIVQKINGNPNLIVALITIPLVCFVHPALGLFILLLSHAIYAHSSLTSVLAASFRSQESQKKQLEISSPLFFKTKTKGTNSLEPLLPTDETTSINNNNNDSPISAKSFIDGQLEMFNYRHSVLILHLFGTLMFGPSFATWLQRLGTVQNYPWFIDSALCIGLILHGLFGSKPNANHISFKLPTLCNSNRLELGLSFIYLICGYYSFISALSLAPYRSLYVVAFAGVFCFVSGVFERNRKDRKSKKHSHKH